MRDPNWELLNGETAHEIEALNYANQVNVIEALVKFVLAVGGVLDNGAAKQFPNVFALKELHRTATLFLLERPGEFREVGNRIEAADGRVVHQPPSHEDVQGHMDSFFRELSEKWLSKEPINIAAFCLWKINWIHPFKNGNGRTARAFTYACLCLQYGFSLPGRVTVIDLIIGNPDNRSLYEQALNHADRAFETFLEPNLEELEALIGQLLVEQLSSMSDEPASG